MAKWERSAVMILCSNPVGSLVRFEFLQTHSYWHEQAVFVHLPKDTCAIAIGRSTCIEGNYFQ